MNQSIPNDHSDNGSVPQSMYKNDIDENDENFFEKTIELAVQEQRKLKLDYWSKGVPWIYINKNGERVKDYGHKKEYF